MTPVRRIVLGFMSTVTVLVLLFGYHTSTSSKRDGESSVAALLFVGLVLGLVVGGLAAHGADAGAFGGPHFHR